MKLPSHIQTIFFDLDNTLIDRDSAMHKAIKDWLHQQHRLSEQEIQVHMELILKKDDSGHTDTLLLCDGLLNTYGNQTSKQTLSAQSLLKELQERAIGYLEPDKQLLDLLQLLKQRYKLLIASNGSTSAQEAKIKQSLLNQIFPPENIYISQSMGCAKPESLFFETILSAIQQRPSQCLMVGDHYRNDIEAAKLAGLSTCFVNKHVTEAGKAADFSMNHINHIASWT